MRLIRPLAILLAVGVAAMWFAAPDTWAGKDWKKVLDPEERMLSESFDLDANAKLRVAVHDADIHLEHGSGNDAKVEVYVTGRNREKAEEYFEKLRFKVEVENNTLRVETKRRNWNINWGWNSSNNIRVYAVITIPSGTDMAVRTSDGNVHADALEGVLNLRTSDGNIHVGTADGETVELKTSDGNVYVGEAQGELVTVSTSDGNVSADMVEGTEVSFRTSDGNVTVEMVKGDDINLRTSDGDIRAGVAGKKLRGRTSDGSIKVKLVSGMAVDLSTSDGNIVIDAPKDIAADINLRGERVRLMGSIDIDGEISRSKVRGKLGGGGVEIVARCSDGTISFELH